MKFTNKLAKAIDVARKNKNTEIIVALGDVKEDTTIKFENGSYIKILKSKHSARSRGKCYRLNDDELEEMLKPFVVRK